MIIIFYIISILLLTIIMISEVKANIIFHRMKDDDSIKINISMFFGLLKFRLRIPYVEVILDRRMKMGVKAKRKKYVVKSKNIFNIEEIKNMYQKSRKMLHRYKKIMDYMLSKIKIDFLKWKTEIGLEDAALTAVSVGAAWSLKYNILSIISQKSAIQKVNIDVIPNYSNIIFQVDLNCIIRIKIVNIIITALKIGYAFLYNAILKRGCEKNERPPYTGIDEDYNG